MLNAISHRCCFNTLERVVKQYLIILVLSFGFIDLLVYRNLWLTATLYGVFLEIKHELHILTQSSISSGSSPPKIKTDCRESTV